MYDVLRILFFVPLFIFTFLGNLLSPPNREFQKSGIAITQPAGSWQTAAPFPTARYDFGSAVFRNKLYVIGGLTLPSPWFSTNRVDMYDPQSDAWTRLKNYPKPVHHGGVIACNDKLYVVGGYRMRIFATSSVYQYDIDTQSWLPRTDMPTRRGALGVACISDKIYAVGGQNEQGQLNTLEVYDTKTDTWEQKTPMPTAREHLSAVALDGKVHVLGGLLHDRYNSLTAHEIYDPTTDSWVAVAPLPHAVNGFVSVTLGDSIFVFGGARGDALSQEVFEYQSKKDIWVRRSDMPVGRYGLGIGVMDNRIHLIGGNTVVKGMFINQNHDVFLP